jgi:hypothetical protein
MLLLAGGFAWASPIGYSVRSDVDRKLYRIDMGTGVATEIGPTGFSKIEGLALSPAGEIYGVNPPTAQLVKCSGVAGTCTAVGILTGLPQIQTNAGLAFAYTGALYLSMNAVIYRVDPATAGTVALGSTGPALAGLAGVAASASCPSGLYGMGGNTDKGKLYCVNTTNGSTTLLGSVGIAPLDVGLDGDPVTGLVWGVSNDDPGQVFAITPSTLALSHQNTVTLAGKAIGGFESLAVARTGTAAVGDVVPAAEGVVNVPTMSGWMLALLALLTAGLALPLLPRRLRSARE